MVLQCAIGSVPAEAWVEAMHPIECEVAGIEGTEFVPSLTRVELAAARGESRASAAVVTIQAEATVATVAAVNLSVFIVRVVSVVCWRQ